MSQHPWGRLYGVTETAERVGLSRRRFYDYVRRHDPAGWVLPGGAMRYGPEDVAAIRRHRGDAEAVQRHRTAELPSVLNVADVALCCCVSEALVGVWLRSGMVKATKPGRYHWAVRAEDLAAAVIRHKGGGADLRGLDEDAVRIIRSIERA